MICKSDCAFIISKSVLLILTSCSPSFSVSCFEAFISSISITEEQVAVAVAYIPMASISTFIIACAVYANSNSREISKLTERIEVLVNSNEASNKRNEEIAAELGKMRKESAANLRKMRESNALEILKLSDKIEALEESNTLLKKTNRGLEEKIEKLEKKIEKLETSNEELKERNQSLSKNKKTLTKKIKALEKEIETLKKNNKSLEERVEQLEESNQDLVKSNQELEETKRKIVESNQILLKNIETLKESKKSSDVIVSMLNMRELFTSYRNQMLCDMNDLLPNGVPKKKQLQDHVAYNGEYTGDVPPKKWISAFDVWIKHVTIIGNEEAHGDRISTPTSKQDAFHRASAIVAEVDESSPDTKNNIMNDMRNFLNVCTPQSRKLAHNNVKNIHSGQGNRRL